MQHPITDRDQSACADSIKRLTLAMREMLGMGPAADIVRDNEAPSAKSSALWPPSVPARLPLARRLTASVSRRDQHGIKPSPVAALHLVRSASLNQQGERS